MSDFAHKETEKLIKRLEKDIGREYSKATKEMRKKFLDYMRRFRIKDDIKRKAVDAGILSKADYMKWRQDQIFNGKVWADKVQELSQDLRNTHKIAVSTAKEYMPEAYAINHNFGAFAIEAGAGMDLSFTVYDRNTVERLIRDNPELLPPPTPGGKTARKLAENKALRWNRQKISSAITQGVLQGESIPKITKRLESVAVMDHNSAIRNARTMMTSAQNAGRMDAARYAKSKGVETTNVWAATLDMRTRHEHRLLDGQRREPGKPFEVDGEEIMFPGDPSAPGYLVYNCRCTLIPQVKGFEYDIRNDDGIDYSQINGMDYAQWKRSKEEITNPITLPEDKAKAIRGSYIHEYIKLREAYGG